MMYYHTCPCCLAHLDPGEICEDCRDAEKAASRAGTSESGIGNKPTIILANPLIKVKGSMKGEIDLDSAAY